MGDRLEMVCPGCGRRGFAWARPTCMYCGHIIAEPPEFPAIRQRLDAMAEEARKEAERVREALRREADAGPPDGLTYPSVDTTSC